jgi:zinc D-Ala-D-Ala dipeptidase
MVTKSYLRIPIVESGEALRPIPKAQFAHQTPHAYEALGAPYGGTSPYFVREQVLQALVKAQQALQDQQPNWQIFIFDAYRPVAVQAFMVNYAFQEALAQQYLTRAELTTDQEEALWEQVLQIWALPSLDPKTPPPHSTGGAVDVTLYDRTAQQLVDMGSPIDELSARSHPHYFAELTQASHLSEAERSAAYTAAQHRQILNAVMCGAGFQRHLGEWWHFCLGDQMWAWLTEQQTGSQVSARYGRV